MHIYIPSMSRARAEEVAAGPATCFPARMHGDISYVVPPEETLVYRRALDECGLESVGLLACPERGIASTRLAIGEHARSAGRKMFAMLDDDIKFMIRKNSEEWNLRPSTEDEVEDMMLAVGEWIDAGFAHVGISAREGNNRMGSGGRDLRNECTRTLRALAYDTRAFLSVEHCRVDVMEDFDVNLQLLEKGHKNVSLHYWSQGQKMTNAPGGCSLYRDHEMQRRAAERLRELHPRFVDLREKKNKTDNEGFGTRTEVTIHWKRAFEESAE